MRGSKSKKIQAIRERAKEAYFVGNFLRQPCKTRSGKVYSKKRKDNSKENILGSLFTVKERLGGRISRTSKIRCAKSLYNARAAKTCCDCSSCKSKSRKDDFCRSSQSGVDLFLQNPDVSSASPRRSPDRIDYSEKRKRKAIKKFTGDDDDDDGECECSACRGPLKKKQPRKRKKYHPLEESSPKKRLRRGRIYKIVNKVRRSTLKRNKSLKKDMDLLKYVLKKKMDTTRSGIECPCCRRFYKALLEVQSFSVKDTEKKNSGIHISSRQLQKIAKLFPHKSEIIAPSGSAGTSRDQPQQSHSCPLEPTISQISSYVEQYTSTQKRFSKLRKDMPHYIPNILFPSAGPKYRKKKRERKSSKTKSKSKKKRSKTTRKPIKKKKEKDDDKKMAPMPSANTHIESTEDDTTEEINPENELDERKIYEIVKCVETPSPSGHVPTYIAMVKTAIRDLSPFKVTSIEAISKYIQIRYRVNNDNLLEYIIKWMVNMGVLRCRSGHYFFTNKRLVKKATVAVLRNNTRRGKTVQNRTNTRRSKTVKKRSNIRRGKTVKRSISKKCRAKPINIKRKVTFVGKVKTTKVQKRKRGKSNTKQSAIKESIKRSKQKKKKSSKNDKKRRKREKKNTCKRDKCTCSRELKSAKNRVKVRTRYVRRNGKIYKQEEYV